MLCVSFDVRHDDDNLPVRALRDRVPDGQTVRKEGGGCRHLAADLPRETGRQAPGLTLRAGGRWPCGRRSGVVAVVPQARPRLCSGSEGPGHSLIPHASASSSRVKVRPSPESDLMRFSASRSPASRRRRRFQPGARPAQLAIPRPYHQRVRSCELLTTTRAGRDRVYSSCVARLVSDLRALLPESCSQPNRRPEPVRRQLGQPVAHPGSPSLAPVLGIEKCWRAVVLSCSEAFTEAGGLGP